MAAPQQQEEKDLPAAAAATDGLEPPVAVYQRSIPRQIRVLEAKISRLQLELNDEMEKIPSCSELLEEIISKPRGSPCSGLRQELHKARAKRDKVYLKHILLLQQAAGDHNDDAHDGAVDQVVAPPPAAVDQVVSPPPAAVDEAVSPPPTTDATQTA